MLDARTLFRAALRDFALLLAELVGTVLLGLWASAALAAVRAFM